MSDPAQIRQWYLEHFAGGKELAGKDLRRHLIGTLSELQALEAAGGQ